jgi:hypothetical protein
MRYTLIWGSRFELRKTPDSIDAAYYEAGGNRKGGRRFPARIALKIQWYERFAAVSTDRQPTGHPPPPLRPAGTRDGGRGTAYPPTTDTVTGPANTAASMPDSFNRAVRLEHAVVMARK